MSLSDIIVDTAIIIISTSINSFEEILLFLRATILSLTIFISWGDLTSRISLAFCIIKFIIS